MRFSVMKLNGKLIARWFLYISLALALCNAVVSNEKPIVAKQNGQWVFPALKDVWFDITFQPRSKILVEKESYSLAIYPPIPYAYSTIGSMKEALVTPMTENHILGTDKLGRDVAAGLVRGVFNAFRVGFISCLLACVIGVILGMLMGFYGNDIIKINILQLFVILSSVVLFIFYLVYGFYGFILTNILGWVLFMVFVSVSLVTAGKFNRLKKFAFPLDIILMRFVEIRKSIPIIILILALLPLISHRQVSHLVLILALLTWPMFARHSRSETMSLMKKEFVQSAQTIGVPFWRLMFHHILPNIMPTIYVVFVFTLVSNILIESALSFLGMGLPPEDISWGSMLNEGRKNFGAWWLTVFPGLFLFFTIYSLNIIGDRFSKRMQ